jgi:hypothetical protein
VCVCVCVCVCVSVSVSHGRSEANPPNNIFPPEVLYSARTAREFCAGNI